MYVLLTKASLNPIFEVVGVRYYKEVIKMEIQWKCDTCNKKFKTSVQIWKCLECGSPKVHAYVLKR